MNTNNILKADVLDIIFDNRNKLYGAYPLRKYYPERVKTALAAMFAIVSLFAVYSLLPSQREITEVLTVVDGPSLGDIAPPEKKEIKPAGKQQQPNNNTQKFLHKIVAVEDDKATDTLHDMSTLNAGAVTNISVTGGLPGDGPGIIPEGGGPVDEVPEEKAPVFNPEIPVDKADIEPAFPGGVNALRSFLERYLTNPEEMAGGEEVKVKVKFVVGYDGVLKGFEIVQDGGAAFNNEVIRVLKKMPNWVPGKSNGRNVSVYHVIPVKFVQNE